MKVVDVRCWLQCIDSPSTSKGWRVDCDNGEEGAKLKARGTNREELDGEWPIKAKVKKTTPDQPGNLEAGSVC